MNKIKTLWEKDTYFRAGAGIILLDNNNHIIMFERSDFPGEFQFSQGGLDVGETPKEGALRELFEETGISESSLLIIGEYPDWLTYEANPAKPKTENYWGQTQKWFYARLKVTTDIDLSQAQDKEFSSYKWVNMTQALEEIVDFKRDMYRKLLNNLERVL